MGTLSGGDGGGWPPDELPDLPPEWGRIVIPDDASELARDARRVRREMRRDVWERRWRRRLHLAPPQPRTADDGSSLGVPLLVISIAVIATLTSLFAIAWPTRAQRPGFAPTAVATTPGDPGPAAPVASVPAGKLRPGAGGPAATVPDGGAGAPTVNRPNGASQPNGATQPTSTTQPTSAAPAGTGTPGALDLPDASSLRRPDFPVYWAVGWAAGP